MAQKDVPRIGWLSPNPSPDMPLLEAFRQGLRELGYIEGDNIAFEIPLTAGKNFLDDRAQELVQKHVTAIVASATLAAHAAKRATETIPIVIVAVGDPVGTGLVASLERPGGNITGLATRLPESSTSRLQLLKDAVPTISYVAVLLNPDNPANILAWQKTEEVAQALGVRLLRLEVRSPNDIEGAFEAASREGADALIVFAEPLTITHRRRIVELAKGHRLPAMYPLEEFVSDGGLLAYGPDFPEMYRRAAVIVDKILKGTRPADLPIDQPTEFELTFNCAAIEALHPEVPQIIRLRFRAQ